MESERVVVAMSGGVDSSVAALLLADRGYSVIGITLRLIACDDPGTRGSCCDADAVVGARSVAAAIDAPHYVVDLETEFEDRILRPAWEEYARGRTPNPCVLCNERIKWRVLEQRADALGARWIATGHHARLTSSGAEVSLRRGVDAGKDQSYFLFRVPRGQLARTLLPVGELTKEEVRAVARERGLLTADRRESQDACLAAADGGFAEALRRRFGAPIRDGDLVDDEGRTVGRHRGIHRYTLGQRRGLGVALGRPAFVRSIDAGVGRVELTTDEGKLACGGLEAVGVRWFDGPAVGEAADLEVQIRYRHRPVPARVERGAGDGVTAHFARPLRAVTPGQAAVFYNGDRVVGGGWIERGLTGHPTTREVRR